MRKISQYFYPQKQTQVMNEGWATFWQNTILNHLYDEGKISDRFMLEVLHSHPTWSISPLQQPVLLGDQTPTPLALPCSRTCVASANTRPRRTDTGSPITLAPTGSRHLHFAMQNFKDESFISQFLSPKVMRDMKLFAIDDDDLKNYLKVSAIHNEEGYRLVRSTLSAQYNLSNLEPNIQVYNVAVKGDRSPDPALCSPTTASPWRVTPRGAQASASAVGLRCVLEQDNGELSADIIGRCPDRKSMT